MSRNFVPNSFSTRVPQARTQPIYQLSLTNKVRLLASIGKEAWFIYSALRVLSSKNGVVRINQAELAQLLGTSDKTVSRHIDSLSQVTVQNKPLMKIQRTFKGNVYIISDFDDFDLRG